jgi:type IV secretory pathway TrbD component
MTDTPSAANFEKTYVDHVAEELQRLQKYADRNYKIFVGLRTALVVFSASLPALTGMGFAVWATVWATMVAILAGVDAQFQPGERWQHFRSAQINLDRIRRDYERRKSVLHGAGDGTTDLIKSEAENFQKLYADAEALLANEMEAFWKFGVTKWRSLHDTKS